MFSFHFSDRRLNLWKQNLKSLSVNVCNETEGEFRPMSGRSAAFYLVQLFKMSVTTTL